MVRCCLVEEDLGLLMDGAELGKGGEQTCSSTEHKQYENHRINQREVGDDEGEHCPLWPAQTRGYPKINASSCQGLGMTGGEVFNPTSGLETSSSKGRPQSGGWPETVPLILEKNIQHSSKVFRIYF